MSQAYVNARRVRSDVKEKGRRCGQGFLDALDRYIGKLISDSCEVRNGGTKTLNATTLDYITGKLK